MPWDEHGNRNRNGLRSKPASSRVKVEIVPNLDGSRYSMVQRSGESILVIHGYSQPDFFQATWHLRQVTDIYMYAYNYI